MLGLNGLIIGILSSKADKIRENQQSHKPKTQGLSQDVFVKSPVKTTYEKDDNGIAVLKLVKSGATSSIQRLDGTELYRFERGVNSETETIFSIEGKKIHETKFNANGSYTKTTYCDNGINVKNVINYDKDGAVKSKRIITPDEAIELTEEEKTRIPEYLYHITSQSNFASITNDGQLRTTTDSHLHKEGNKAVFLLDKKNFLNKWNTIKNGEEISYITRLLQYCNKDKNGKLLVLRIPTSKLDLSKLCIRNQDELLDSFPVFKLPKKEQDEYFAFGRLFEKIHPNKRRAVGMIKTDIFFPEKSKRLINGESLRNLSKKETKPLEFLYKGDIPVSIIKDTKIINASEISKMSYYEEATENYAIDLLKEAFEE